MTKPQPTVPLTVPQAEVRDMILEGTTIKDIAKKMGLTPSGVNYNLADVYKKYRVRNKTELLLRFMNFYGGYE